VVHGDLSANVLFAPHLPPAVIDFSWYWRPSTYAEGIVIADALCWHGADQSVLELAGVTTDAVARGLLFRLATTNVIAHAGEDLQGAAQRFTRATSALGI
jgi:hypothetical protein